MATVQGINEPQQSGGWVAPAAGAVIGAGLGGWYGSKKPAYETFGDLVKEATSKDNFEMAKAADDATEEVKGAFTAVEKGIEKVKEDKKAVEELFKDGENAVDKAEFKKVAEKFGWNISKENLDAPKINLADAVKDMKAGEEVKITEDMLKMFDNGETKGVAKNVSDTLASIGAKIEGEKITVTDDMIKGAKEWAGKKDLLAMADDAAKNEGKVAKDAVENFLSKGSQAVQDSYAKIATKFGTSWKKWGAIGLAAGLVVGWAASKMFGSKEAA